MGQEVKEKKKVVMHNIDGDVIDFDDDNLQEKITYESANFIRRLVAWFIDLLLIIVIWYLFSLKTFHELDAYIKELGIDPNDFQNAEVLKEFAKLYHKSIVKLFLFFYFAQTLYYTLLPAIIGEGRTLGKLICGIGVVDAKTLNEISPTRLIFREFICRTLVETILIIPLIVSCFIAFFREDSKSLHDLMAKTVVIKLDLYEIE